MSTKTFSLVLDIDRDLTRPLADVPTALLTALSPVFAPRVIWVLINNESEIDPASAAMSWGTERCVARPMASAAPSVPARARDRALPVD